MRRAVLQLSVAGSLALGLTLVLLSGGSGVSLAQVSLSPSCSLIDPITGLCQTVTSIISPTTTTTTTTLPTTTTTTTTTTSSGGTTTGSTGSGGGSSSGGGTGTGSTLSGGNAPFGSSAYAPGGLFFGAYGGSGGGTTFFAPGTQTQTSSQVYYQSAFGAPVSKAVAAAAVGPLISTAPVASAITQLPRSVVVLFPAAVLLMLVVTALVLEVNEGGVGPDRMGLLPPIV